jgi:hypothetical protein
MKHSRRPAMRSSFTALRFTTPLAAIFLTCAAPLALAQINSYTAQDVLLKTPHEKVWGPGMFVVAGPGGVMYAMDRCSGETCVGSSEAPIYKFDKSGRPGKELGSRFVRVAAFLNGRSIWVRVGN